MAGAGDGILAIDLGAEGQTGFDSIIDQSKQMVFREWASGTTSDMQALRQVFDTNQDGKLDLGDALWQDFRIWQDVNGNGVSDPGEVKTLDQLGIASIDLNPTGPVLHFADGSVIQALSTFTRTDGTTGAAADVALAYGSPTLPQIILPRRLRPLAAGGQGSQSFGAPNSSVIESQLNQLVQALAIRSPSSGGLDQIVAKSAQLHNDQGGAQRSHRHGIDRKTLRPRRSFSRKAAICVGA
jgi:hypothetical protein